MTSSEGSSASCGCGTNSPKWRRRMDKLITHHCCLCVDHEKGAKIICWLFVAVTTATFAIHFYQVSIVAFYWQTLSLVKNIALWRAVKTRRGGYLVPWLVVVAVSMLALPILFGFAYVINMDKGEELAAALWLSFGIPVYLFVAYSFYIVWSLFVRYTDPRDPIHETRWGTRRVRRNKANDDVECALSLPPPYPGYDRSVSSRNTEQSI